MPRPRTEPEHGSPAGYQRHKLAREDACADCLRAWRDYHRRLYRLRQQRSARAARQVSRAG